MLESAHLKIAIILLESKSCAIKLHLYLPIETVTSLTVSTSQLMYSGRQLRSVLNLNSFNLRMTVEVETAKLSAKAVIGTFSISF